MWQVAGLYLAFSWIVLQITQTLTEGLALPGWVVPFALILLAIGLPVVLVTAFIQKGMATRRPAPKPQSLDEVEEVPPGEAPTGEAPTGEPAPLGGAVRALTWKRTMLGGVAALVLLVVMGTAWTITRSLGIGPAATLLGKGVLGERDVILLADFENSTSDETLGEVVTEALRVDLSQAEAVRLAEPAFLAAAIARMQREPVSGLSEELALEVAKREGLKAVVVGDVARAGPGYVLSASVVAAEDGAILVSHRESARDSTGLIDAINDLSRRIRERIGDPLASLAASPALADVTTSSLEALRSYSQATRLPEAEAQRRIALFARATEQDSTFAMAWNALGIALANYGVEPGRAMKARTRAFELREHLTERERNAVASMYYLGVTREPRQAIPFLESIADADPTESRAMNNLGEAYRNLGDLETALEWYHRSIATDSSTSAIPFMNLAQVSATLGDVAAVDEYADLMEVYAPGPFADWHRAMGPAIHHDYAASERSVLAARDSVMGSPFLLANTTLWVASIAAIRGRLSASRELWEVVAAIQVENGSTVEALRSSIALAVELAMARGEGGRAELDAALSRFPLAEMDPVERPYLDVAEAYALIGDADAAKRFVEEFEQETPPDFQRGFRFERHRVLGEIARLEGRFDDAVAEFRQSSPRPQELEPMAQLARAFDSAGRPDSARVHYQRFLDSSHWLSMVPHAKFLASSLERFAELEYEAGNLPAAARYYAEFVELWADADPELQPRVEAAQARLEDILNAIG